jgi:leader peptidase (prepilin peptidase)/N-methyltransferase
MAYAVAVIGGVFGSIIGSFLNVVVYRMPRRLSVVAPPSACPQCGHRIRGRDNVPVLSWLLLRGRCRDCAAPISVRYPLVELGTAVFFAAVVWRAVAAGTVESGAVVSAGGAGSGPGWALELIAFLYLASISVSLTLIDIDTHVLPDRIVLPAYIIGAALLGAAALLTHDYGQLVSAAVGLAALWLLYFAMFAVYPGGMGFGDVKLAGVLGLFLGFLGWGTLAVGAFAAFVLGGLFAAVLLVAGRATRKSTIPFGPWMLAGSWLGIFFGPVIAAAYLTVFGLA